jgi:hypothetical protein
MFVVKARSLPYSGAPEKSFILVGSGLTNNTIGWKGLLKDKHSSLLLTCVNYGRKRFITLGP